MSIRCQYGRIWKGLKMPKMSDAHMSLGELIKALEAQPEDHAVNFDFGGLTPTECASYRGYYSDLAIGFTKEPSFGDMTVAKLLAELRGCVGRSFEGYKGGTYIMFERTPVWVANWGNTGGTGVVGVKDKSYMTMIETADVD